MIVVDTSALLAIVFDEARSAECREVLLGNASVAISAGTLSEALVVAGRNGGLALLDTLLRQTALEVVSVTEGEARRVEAAYGIWGKGVHPAKLNWGDCFAYSLAKARDCPLLYIGNDFAQTDIASAL